MANDFIGAQLANAAQCIERGELKEAATLLNALLSSAPTDPRIHFVAALLAQKANNTMAWIHSLERALDLAPTWVIAHVEHIRAISQHGEAQLAVDASVEALSLCGDSLELLEIASAVTSVVGNFS